VELKQKLPDIEKLEEDLRKDFKFEEFEM